MKTLLTLAATKITIPGIPHVNVDEDALRVTLNMVFLVLGGIAVLFILIGAVRYALSQNDQGQMAQAKNTILYAAIGLVISGSAFLIVQFVLGVVINP